MNGKTVVEITQAEQKKEKKFFFNEDSLRDFWDKMKHSNIHIIGASEGKEREKGAENLFEEIIELLQMVFLNSPEGCMCLRV